MVLIVAAMNSICLRCMSTCTLRPFTIILLVLASVVGGNDTDVRSVEHGVGNRAGQVFTVVGSRQVHRDDSLLVIIENLTNDAGKIPTRDRQIDAAFIVVHIRGS